MTTKQTNASTEAAMNTIKIGDRVATLNCIPEDSDSGIVHDINGDIATVGWDSGVSDTCIVDDLELEA